MNNIQEEMSKKTLQRVKQNDTTLKGLELCDDIISFRTGERLGQFAKGDYDVLGAYVGKNTNLKQLHCGEISGGIANFCDGLRLNTSIKALVINVNNVDDIVDGGVLQKILEAYQENDNLTFLSIIHAYSPDSIRIDTVNSALQRYTNLETLNITGCGLSPERLSSMVNAISGEHNKLKHVRLPNNLIQFDGCRALKSLLEGSNCNIQFLDLSNNYIYSDGAIVIASSLLKNRSLRTLDLHGNPRGSPLGNPITLNDGVLHVFSNRVLCNISSIQQTYSSNHTLEDVDFGSTRVQQMTDGKRLISLLELNKGSNKGHVAIKKILLHHPDFDIEQFYQWDSDGERSLKALPHLISWYDRAKEAVADDEARGFAVNMNQIEIRKLSAIYQFARDMPVLVARDESTGVRGGGG